MILPHQYKLKKEMDKYHFQAVLVLKVAADLRFLIRTAAESHNNDKSDEMFRER